MHGPSSAPPTRPARRLALLAVALLLAGSPAGAAPGEGGSGSVDRREAREALRAGDYDAPTVGWREGPVRYLLTNDEDQAYRRLTAREERARFIERFWASRDPDTSTPANEFRDLFYRRVVTASQLFIAESTKPGWKTDRGKIYVLLGPPDDLDEISLQEQNTELITWTYRDLPAGTGASPNAQVRFLRDHSGEYRLTTQVRLFSSETAMSRALSLQALQMRSLPGAHGVPDGAVEQGAGGEAAPLRAHADLFRAGGGLAMAVLTVWVQESLLPPPTAGSPGGPTAVEVAARLVGEGTAAGTYDLSGARALRPGPDDWGRGPGGTRIYQGSVAVVPGSYAVTYTVTPPGGPEVASLHDTLTVPRQDETVLAVGPIAFAARLDRPRAIAATDAAATPAMGRLRAVPRGDDLFRPGEDLSFYYQVVGASTDPIEGLPDIDLEYRFYNEGAGPDGTMGFKPFGQPIHLSGEQAFIQGFSLPLAGWASGRYRLEVTATDNLSGASARGQTVFRVR